MKKTDSSFPAFVLEQLAPLKTVTAQKMFGGVGFRFQGAFFGIISSESKLYFRTNEDTRAKYDALKMSAFMPGGKSTMSQYLEVPGDILENDELLSEWAREAAATQAVKKAKPARKVVAQAKARPAVAAAKKSVAAKKAAPAAKKPAKPAAKRAKSSR